MKKKIFLLSFLVLLAITGCKKNNKVDYKEQLLDYASDVDEYQLTAQMKVMKEDGEVSFHVEVSYLEPNYYKVVMKNLANNNIQIVLKNDEGVFVITPAMNKLFKFNSDWPLNSSYAYLYQSIVKDITNDPASMVKEDGNNYQITSKINHKTNANLVSQTVTFDKKSNAPLTNTLYDVNNKPLVVVTFTSFKTDVDLKKSDFDEEVANNTVKLEMAEGTVNIKINECVPTFMPEGYAIATSVADENHRVVNYAKDGNTYIITCVLTSSTETLTVSREFVDVVELDLGMGFVNEKSLSFFNGNLFVSIYNEDFKLDEAVKIANSFVATNKAKS